MNTYSLENDSILVNEIFFSIQGESSRAGEPCIFVRLTGCGLRCVWCDTAYAFYEGSTMTYGEIKQCIEKYNCNLIEFSGGEPLEQSAVFPFIAMLCDDGYEVLVETGGHVDISTLHPNVCCIMDLKCPFSKMQHKNRWENIKHLQKKDEVKFVIADATDFDWAKEKLFEHNLHERCGRVLFSPAYGIMENSRLAEWILRDALPVRFQVQLHKYIWEPNRRGV